MPCCHADFTLAPDSDKAFTVGMPTFTFGAGCLAEAGEHARELGLSRVALFTDTTLRLSAHVAAVLASLKAAGIDATVYDEVVVEPTTASFQAAARFAAEGSFDGYVSVKAPELRFSRNLFREIAERARVAYKLIGLVRAATGLVNSRYSSPAFRDWPTHTFALA